MTRARNGAAAKAAPVRDPHWHTLPLGEQDEETGRRPQFEPRCDEGDVLLARLPGGEVANVIFVRGIGGGRHFERCDDEHQPTGEAVEPEAIAVPPRGYRPSKHTAADRRAAGRVALQVWITPEQKRRLEWIKTEDGFDFATIVGCHIDQEYEGRKGER